MEHSALAGLAHHTVVDPYAQTLLGHAKVPSALMPAWTGMGTPTALRFGLRRLYGDSFPVVHRDLALADAFSMGSAANRVKRLYLLELQREQEIADSRYEVSR